MAQYDFIVIVDERAKTRQVLLVFVFVFFLIMFVKHSNVVTEKFIKK